MRLNASAFNSFLSHMGESIVWRRAYACPCINPNSGAANPTCVYCGGKGRVWADPVTGDAGISGESVQREWAQMGVWMSGDVVLALPGNSALYAMSQFDRALMVNSSQPFSVTLTRGQFDTLPSPAVSIDRVYWLDASQNEVDGAIPAINADGSLDWPDDTTAPPSGTVYSITGRRQPEYFCWGEFPRDRSFHHGATLPRRVVLRLFDLYGR